MALRGEISIGHHLDMDAEDNISRGMMDKSFAAECG